jgi:uncharacterized membrane protein
MIGDHLRFHRKNEHLSAAFGSTAFGRIAERFARFLGTPSYLSVQTAIVAVWIAANVAGIAHFDLYPFILLNLAFSLQAAYAAPLILLAQTRQADRDKAATEADAQHREEISGQILALLQQNTALTEQVKRLTDEIHGRVVVELPH